VGYGTNNPPGYFASKAYGINNLGQIVGEAIQTSTHRVHAVVWTVS
jgi:probable HAF family extracellular repeat protein